MIFNHDLGIIYAIRLIIHVLFSFNASKTVREIVSTKTKIAKLRLLTFKGNVKLCNRASY